MTIRTFGAALAAAMLGVSAAGAQVPDHLQCYKIKDSSIVLKGTIDLSNTPFGTLTGCKVSSAKLYCIGAEKQNPNVLNITTPIAPLPYSAPPVTEDRLCYKVSCRTSVFPPDQTVTDQFGQHNLTKLKTGMFCTPVSAGTSYCGDGTLDAGEDCDGVNLGGATCVSEGFGSGALACGPGCRYDTSGCIAGAFPASGQTTCYNAAGGVIACPGTGQDGALEAGANLAYVDNGDGTVTDLNSGLMWEKKSDDGTVNDRDTLYTWSTAFSHVTTLNGANFAGHADWRLPNVRELQSIINYGTTGPAAQSAIFHTGCFGGCTVLTCSCTAFAGYWSSTTVQSVPSAAFNVNFFDGTMTALAKGATGSVRAVRGGP